MSKRVLLLGAGIMQGVAIRCARERGWETVVIDGNPEAPCRDLTHRFEHIDLKDVSSIVSFAKELSRNGGLDGVFTAATDFSVPVSAVAEACGLPGHSLEAAMNASDKLRMRSCFKNAGVSSPACAGITSGDLARIPEILAEAQIGFPLVVKPVDNMGARGCMLVRDLSVMEDACADAIRYSRTGRAIVEEYMSGPEYSVEALVFDGEFHLTGFAERHIFFPPYFVEMGHTIPAAISPEDEQRILTVFRAGASALGLTHGAVKGDMKLTEKGPMVGEIAARLSGGYMSGWTYPYSSGIDLTGAALSLAVGERPESLKPALDLVCAERAWISIPGTVRSVHGVEEASRIPGVRDVLPRAGEGSRVYFPRNNVEKCGNCLAVSENRNDACRAAEQACAAIFLRLAVHDVQTESFLDTTDDSFPPSAFCGISFPDDTDFTPVAFEHCGQIPVPDTLCPALDLQRDWQNRSLRDCLTQALRYEPGLYNKLVNPDKKKRIRYWNALLRGGIQGIVYRYDCETKKTD